MSAFDKEDLGKLAQLVGAIKRAHFEKLTVTEIMGVNNAFLWMNSLGEKIQTAINESELVVEELAKRDKLILELDEKLKEKQLVKSKK